MSAPSGQAKACPTKYAFWYIFATNGADGFLLDLIRRPGECLARLVTYRQGRPPRIVLHGFGPSGLKGAPGALGAALGGISLDAFGCRGALPGMHLDARFALNGRAMRFVPGFVTWWFDAVPDFRSHYGVLEQAICEGAVYEDAPFVCSTYSLESLAAARWVLISAPRFAGTDLAFEISGARLLGAIDVHVRFIGEQETYEVDTPNVAITLLRPGVLFSAAGYRATGARFGLRLDVEARGSIDQFARLDADRQTEIHTTLFGACRATVDPAGQTFLADKTCLLEVKN